MRPFDSIGVLAPVGVVVLILSMAGCAGGLMTYGGYDDPDDGPAFDYDTGVYDPGGFDYGWWGGGEYLGGPPVYGYGGDGDRWRWGDGRNGRFSHGDDRGHDGFNDYGRGWGHGPRPYRAAPPSRAIPSIPSRPRGGGFRGGGPRNGGHR